MRLLLFADTHIVDSPTEEYRWKFFEEDLPKLIFEHGIDKLWCLGDLSDRRDRHSSTLVNRFVASITKLYTPLEILMGNHDGALGYQGGHYWAFLSQLPHVRYTTFPGVTEEGILVLPFSPNPIVDWAKLQLSSQKAVFMHQTCEGALIEGNRTISKEDAHRLPILPRNIPIYSGDVHRPQKIGPITYVGTPYPVRFGEDWPGRVLIIDTADFSKYEEIILPSIKRKILDLNPASLEKISTGGWGPGDQIRVRFALSPNSLAAWPEDEARIRDLVATTGATLLSVETVMNEDITTEDKSVATPGKVEELSPKETLLLFGKEEKLSQELVDVGISIMEKAL